MVHYPLLYGSIIPPRPVPGRIWVVPNMVGGFFDRIWVVPNPESGFSDRSTGTGDTLGSWG